MHNYSISCIYFDDDTSIYHDIRYIDTTEMCIDTVSLLNVSRYGDISICRCISNVCMYVCMLNKNTWGVKKCGANQKQHCKQAGATKRFDIS